MLHMIGNAHLDPVWLWRWTEGCAEALATCWAAVDRLEEGSAFVFTRGEASIYSWIEEFDPALFQRIAHFIRQGRWYVVNGWWVQPDCNLPSGECFIRQALIGKAYFQEKFGIEPHVGFNVDSFGHAETLPMLLRHTGFDSYVFMRPGPHEKSLPANLFEWVSSDGSHVPTFRIQVAYNTSPRNLALPEKTDRHLAMERDEGHPFMLFYGVGNHGGGPTKDAIAHIAARIEAGEAIAFSDPSRFFRDVEGLDLPKVSEELQFHAIGCYAVGASLKSLNRLAESRLSQAEAAAALATDQIGVAYPRSELRRLWRTLLFNQFHDTLGGTAIRSACVDAERELGMVVAGAEHVLNASVRHLSSSIRPVPDAREAHFLLINLGASEFDGIVEAEPWTDFDAVSKRTLVDEDGAPVPFQYVAPEGRTRGLQRVAFRVKVPGFGRRLVSFNRDEVAGLAPPSVNFGQPVLADDPLAFSTSGWTLVLDRKLGTIVELRNRSSGTAVFTGPAHRAIVVDDPSDTWSHGLDRFGFSGEDFELEGVSVLERGPVRTAIEVRTRSGQSTMTTVVSLPNDPDLPVDLAIRLDWRERRRLLRLAYPLGGKAFEYEVPAGWTERPDDGKEVFGHRWVRCERAGFAVVVANDAKYSYAASDGTLYITAVRSPVFAHHDPIVLEEGASYDFMDQGEQRFVVRVHADHGLTRQKAATLADELCKPIVSTPHVARRGTGEWRGQWLAVDPGTTNVMALKLAETSDDLVLRCVELDGIVGDVAVRGASFRIEPRAIATAISASDGQLRMVDGLER